MTSPGQLVVAEFCRANNASCIPAGAGYSGLVQDSEAQAALAGAVARVGFCLKGERSKEYGKYAKGLGEVRRR